MVMEAPPSPQCVGREFVRQYYTLLNQAPTHLHRFYNNNSSFVHGGDALNRDIKPVVGQKNIHLRIQQLNFRDCHAKISQVDSQATLGNGVVVQVSGELSNSGQPMRRFTQTFVLAAQSPKKYYVHNDIFRYQDFLFGDEETEDSGRSEQDEEEHAPDIQREVSAGLMTSQSGGYYQQQQQQQMQHTPQPQMNGAHHEEQQQSAPLPHQTLDLIHTIDHSVMGVSTGNQGVAAEGLNQYGHEDEDEEVEAVAREEEDEEEDGEEALPVDTTPQVEPHEEEVAEEGEGVGEHCIEPELSEQVCPLSNEPKTYATLVKSGSGIATTLNTNAAPYYSNNSPSAPAVNAPPPKSPASPPPQMSRFENSSGMGPRGARGGRGGANIRGMSSRPNERTSTTPPKPVQEEQGVGSFGVDGDRRRTLSGPQQQYSDSQQLFMGNIPHSATEEQLRELFGRYGPIVDLRILSKSNPKGPTGNRVPNYGFIVYENVNDVQAVLNAKPINFPGEDGNTKLNVEEKKARPRGPMGGDGRGGPRMNQGGGGPMGRGNMRGGRGGGSWPMRPPNNNYNRR